MRLVNLLARASLVLMPRDGRHADQECLAPMIMRSVVALPSIEHGNRSGRGVVSFDGTPRLAHTDAMDDELPPPDDIPAEEWATWPLVSS